MEERYSELNIKVTLRNERDLLLEIKRVTPEDATEAHRIIDKRLATIRESLES